MHYLGFAIRSCHVETDIAFLLFNLDIIYLIFWLNQAYECSTLLRGMERADSLVLFLILQGNIQSFTIKRCYLWVCLSFRKVAFVEYIILLWQFVFQYMKNIILLIPDLFVAIKMSTVSSSAIHIQMICLLFLVTFKIISVFEDLGFHYDVCRLFLLYFPAEFYYTVII